MPVDTIRSWLEYAKSPLILWVAASILAYTLVVNVLWLLRPARHQAVHRQSYWQPLVQAGRFLFFLGVPYLALGGWPRPPFSGLLSLDDLGLVGFSPRWPAIRWLGAVGTGLGMGLLAFVVLLLAWLSANRPRQAGRFRFASRPMWALLVDGLYLQVHWAFYRGALAVVLDDVYPAVFLGLGLVYLEWALNPFWRQGWRQSSGAAGRWLRAALALVSALVFLSTRNLWVCLGVHWLVELAFWRLGRETGDRIHRIEQDLQEPLEAL